MAALAASAPVPTPAPFGSPPTADGTSSSSAPAAATSSSSSNAPPQKQPQADIPPNNTVYVNNLNERVKKEDLKKSLYHVFSQFGNILEVVALKTYKLRGQAWIIFEDLSGSTKAVKDMQNFNFYGKPMRVSFARSKSDVIAKQDGSFAPRPKRKAETKSKKKEEREPKKKKTGEKDGKKEGKRKEKINGVEDGALPKEKSKHDDKEKKDKKDESAAAAAAGSGSSATTPSKTPASALYGGTGVTTSAAQYLSQPDNTMPNRILFVENLPTETTTLMLQMLFNQYAGFQEARLINGKPGIAFVEFTDAYNSGIAMQALQGFKITPTHLMKITFAKR